MVNKKKKKVSKTEKTYEKIINESFEKNRKLLEKLAEL